MNSVADEPIPRCDETLEWCALECEIEADERRGGYNTHEDVKALRDMAARFRAHKTPAQRSAQAPPAKGNP